MESENLRTITEADKSLESFLSEIRQKFQDDVIRNKVKRRYQNLSQEQKLDYLEKLRSLQKVTERAEEKLNEYKAVAQHPDQITSEKAREALVMGKYFDNLNERIDTEFGFKDPEQTSDYAEQTPAVNMPPSAPEETEHEWKQTEETMDQAAMEYIKNRRISRSVFSIFGGQDQKMFSSREEYERLRNDRIIKRVLSEEIPFEDQLGRRRHFSSHAASLIISEMERFRMKEAEYLASNPHHRFWSTIYRNPWSRAAVGLGINVGLGISAASGMLPATAILTAARVIWGAVGFEGVYHGIQDEVSRSSGARKPLSGSEIEKMDTKDLQVRIGSLDEDIMRKNRSDNENLDSTLAYAEYRMKLARSIEEELAKNGVVFSSPPLESLHQSISNADKLLPQKDQALIFERNSLLSRSAAGLLTSALFTFIPWRSLIPNPFEHTPAPPATPTPVAVSPEPTVPPPLPTPEPDTVDYAFLASDPYFANTLENDTVSSVKGLAEGQLALNHCHINYFDPYNPENTSMFRNCWNQDPLLNFRRIQAYIDFVKDHNPPPAFRSSDPDLMSHFLTATGRHTFFGPEGQLITYKLPKDPASLFANVR